MTKHIYLVMMVFLLPIVAMANKINVSINASGFPSKASWSSNNALFTFEDTLVLKNNTSVDFNCNVLNTATLYIVLATSALVVKMNQFGAMFDVVFKMVSGNSAMVEASEINLVMSLDSDRDQVPDKADNCTKMANANQVDGDGDGVGDVCDNCRYVANKNQADKDDDRVGDVCDNCANSSNADQKDSDSDAIGDVCDNCAMVANVTQANSDADAFGDRCDCEPFISNTNTTFPDCAVTSLAVMQSTLEENAYPNPVMDALMLNAKFLFQDYRLIDRLGKEVQRGNVENATIDIGALPTGTYILLIDIEAIMVIKE